jgi:ketosteroid isomerase-like protein
MRRILASFSTLLLTASAAFAQSPAPLPAANQATTTASPEVQQFQKLEDSWSLAINNRDQYGLELVLSPLFVDISSTGDIATRNQQLATLLSGEDKTLHLEQKVIAVRTLGDVVVVNGTYFLHHKLGAAQVDEKGVFTHVFERVRGGWVCTNSQRTQLRADSNVASKPKKPSNAEMPFHLPIFSK